MEIIAKSGAVAATILAIAIISVGTMIYNSASSEIYPSFDDMDSSLNVVEPEEDYITSTLKKEAEEFNSAFMKYEGTVNGKNVIALLALLTNNAKENKLYEDKLPDVFFEPTVNSAGLTITSTVDNPREKEFKNFMDQVETTHDYFITFEYSSVGLIEKINIYYARPIYGEY